MSVFKVGLRRCIELVAFLVIMGGWTAPGASADTAPSIATFGASPATISSGQSAVVTATVDGPLNGSFLIRITDSDSHENLKLCSTGTTCAYTVSAPWYANSAPQARHLTATVIDSTGAQQAVSVALTVPVARVTWDLQLSANPNPARPGTTSVLTATSDKTVTGTGYSIAIVNADTNENLKFCNTGTSCTVDVGTPWFLNVEAAPRRFRALVQASATGDTAGAATEVLDVQHVSFTVAMSFAAGGGGWSATATATPALTGTGYSIKIKRADASAVELYSCSNTAASSSCNTGLVDGSFYATVEDNSGAVLGRSGLWRLTGSTATDQTIDGINMPQLALLYATPSAVCNTLTTYQGSHVAGSSVTDQQLACEAAAAQSGATVASVISAALAAGTGATAVLWYLHDQAVTHADPNTHVVQPPAPANPEDPPVTPIPDTWPPAPPGSWPADEESDLDYFVEHNPGRFSSRGEARIALRSCRRLNERADCLGKPTFFSGDLDTPAVTDHIRDATYALEETVRQPSVLTYRGANNSISGWYKLAANTPNACYATASQSLVPVGQQCDEYPFGNSLEAGPGTSLRAVPARQNNRQGGYLRAFTKSCAAQIANASSRYLVVALPQASYTPTTWACNAPLP